MGVNLTGISNQIKTGMEQIEKSTQFVASSSEEFSASTQEISSLSGELSESITKLDTFINGTSSN